MAQKPRSVSDIDQEYYRKCAELGDREFKMTQEFPRQIEVLKREMSLLIRESEQALALDNKQKADKAKQASNGSKKPTSFEPKNEQVS